MNTQPQIRATANLRLYISEAVLPDLPIPLIAPLHEPLFKDYCIDESGHLLEIINEFVETYFDRHVIDCECSPSGIDFTLMSMLVLERHVETKIYADNDADPLTGLDITIPSPIWFNVPAANMAPITSAARFRSFVYSVLLQTSLRLFHLIFPHHSTYDIVRINQSGINTLNDQAGVYHFRDGTMQDVANRNRRGCVLIFIPPWLLTKDAIHAFAKRNTRSGVDYDRKTQGVSKATPLLDINEPIRPISFNTFLWSYVHHTCATLGSSRFVISTYNNWVFGAFTAGWTQSYVSPVHTSSSHHPTILAMCLHWFGSAIGAPYGVILEELYEPVKYVAPDFRPTEYAIARMEARKKVQEEDEDAVENMGHWMVRQPLHQGTQYYRYQYTIGRDGRRNVWPGMGGWPVAQNVGA